MSREPLVSIIIPSFNSAAFLKSAIESAINQTWKNREIIVVDDGSTDASWEIAQSYLAENVIVHRQVNAGACVARNTGFKMSKGDYIQFLDADDLLSASKLESQIALFKKYGHQIIVSGKWDRFYDDAHEAKFPDRFLDRDWDNPIEWLISSWEGKGMGQTGIWLTHRNLIEQAGKWDERLAINQDGEFFCRVLLQAHAIRFCSEAKIYYRSGIGRSISTQVGAEKAASLLLSYQLYEEHVGKKIDIPAVRHALMVNYSSVIYQFYNLYPEIAHQALVCIKNLGFRSPEFRDGYLFNFLANVLGYKNTFRLKQWINGNEIKR